MSTDSGPAYRALVYSLFVPAVGLGALSLVPVLPDEPLFAVAGSALALGWLAAAPLLYLDASALVDRPIGDWHLSPPKYAVAGLLAGPFATVYYLRRRHDHLGVTAGRRGWWAGVLAGLAGVLALFAGFVLPPSEPELTVAFTVAAACYAVFPIAVYHDARNVRAGDSDWEPEPATATLLAVLTTPTLVLTPLFALGYLGRRVRTVEGES